MLEKEVLPLLPVITSKTEKKTARHIKTYSLCGRCTEGADLFDIELCKVMYRLARMCTRGRP